jgi:4-amino-4-deoxy-L-arabinose transferase-like glycosyltransferase
MKLNIGRAPIMNNTFSRFMQKKWDLLLPLLACLIAFALRYHFLVTYPYPMMIHEQDAVGYMDVAKHIVRFAPLEVAGRPPGYPIVIAIFSFLPVSLEYAARLASIFMDSLIVFSLYFIARIFLNRISSFAVCLLWAFFSFSLTFVTSPLSQSSFLFYLLTGILFLYQGLIKNNKGWLFGAGVFIALSYLARPEGIVGFGSGFLLCMAPLFNRGITMKRAAVIPFVFLLGFILIAGPYLIALHNHLGYWALTTKSEAALKTQDGVLVLNSMGELQKPKLDVSIWKEYYGTLPIFIKAVAQNIKSYFAVYVTTFPMWMHIVSLTGMILILVGNKARYFPYILILLLVTAPNYIVNVSKTHSYLYSIYPAMFICFIACFEQVANMVEWAIDKFISGTKPVAYEAALPIVLLLSVSYIAFGFYQEADATYQSPGLVEQALMSENIFKEAGEIIKLNSQKNDIIMTRWGLVGYFAERPVLTLPKGGVKEVVDYGRKNGASFLLIDTMSVLSRRQEFMELLEPLAGKTVNPEYGIEILGEQYYPDLGGYVIYRYLR